MRHGQESNLRHIGFLEVADLVSVGLSQPGCGSIIAGAVVDDDDLDVGVSLAQGAIDRFGDIVGAVINWDDD